MDHRKGLSDSGMNLTRRYAAAGSAERYASLVMVNRW